MIQSMTGFGSAEREGCRVEVRSVNHRFLDIYMRAPSFLNQLEIPFRNILKEKFSRGKIDINVTVSAQAAAVPEINAEAVRKLYQAFRKLQEDLSIQGELDINTIVGLREMFIETGQKIDLEAITAIFKEAVEDLFGMRNREGGTLAVELRRMTDSLGTMNEKIRALSGNVVVETRNRFNERLKLLLEGSEIDGSRILQEAAIIAARLDISEEMARIESHLEQFREILSRGGIIGRKLDFILQELNREVNTIASKSADYDTSSLTVEMKTEIEKIREQVQNLQ